MAPDFAEWEKPALLSEGQSATFTTLVWWRGSYRLMPFRVQQTTSSPGFGRNYFFFRAPEAREPGHLVLARRDWKRPHLLGAGGFFEEARIPKQRHLEIVAQSALRRGRFGRLFVFRRGELLDKYGLKFFLGANGRAVVSMYLNTRAQWDDFVSSLPASTWEFPGHAYFFWHDAVKTAPLDFGAQLQAQNQLAQGEASVWRDWILNQFHNPNSELHGATRWMFMKRPERDEYLREIGCFVDKDTRAIIRALLQAAPIWENQEWIRWSWGDCYQDGQTPRYIRGLGFAHEPLLSLLDQIWRRFRPTPQTLFEIRGVKKWTQFFSVEAKKPSQHELLEALHLLQAHNIEVPQDPEIWKNAFSWRL